MSAGLHIKTASGLVPAATVPGLPGSQGPTGPTGLTGPKGDPGGWVQSVALSDTDNLDNILTPGTYFRGTSVNTLASNGYPADSWAGWVEVTALGTASAAQRAISISSEAPTSYAPTIGKMWQRQRFGSTWYPWQRIHLQGNIGGGDLTGTGFPEGVVSAPVGTYYTDTAGTNGAWRWLKTSGSGNTGWKAITGDTGRRDVSSLLDTTGTVLDNTKTNKLFVRRTTDYVFVEAVLYPVVAQGTTLATLPTGFIPNTLAIAGAGVQESGSPWRVLIPTINSSGNLAAWGTTTPGSFKTSIVVTAPSLVMAWPVSLPGVAG